MSEYAAIRRTTIDISATCGGSVTVLGNGVREVESCSWTRGWGTNRQVRAAARRHAMASGHGVSVEECTDTTYRRRTQ